MTETFADKINRFNQKLSFEGTLPEGTRMMNPFEKNDEVLPISEVFYRKFYNDHRPRKIIIGINPGRFGAGVTGIPFTDSKRLQEICGIKIGSVSSHEVSSVFVYDVIERYGGVEKFYGDFYINSMCPLGLIRKNNRGNWVNCNYYDDKYLYETLKPYIIGNLKQQIGMGVNTDCCYVMGKKNAKYFNDINQQEGLFDNFTILEHPRYIEQYQQKNRERFISDYVEKLRRGCSF